MNQTDITTGAIYTDGKSGLRKTLAVGPQQGTLGADRSAVDVQYEVLAASRSTDVGKIRTMRLPSFATWSTGRLSEREANTFLFEQQAERAARKLTYAQRGFLQTFDDDLTQDACITCNREELRVATSCYEKGLLTSRPVACKNSGYFDVQFTALGLAVLAKVKRARA